MKTADFDYFLPASAIADRPVEPRDAARMLVVKDGECVDSHIRALDSWLRAGDVLVLNNSKVIPARLTGMRDEVKAEVLLHKPVALPLTWRVFGKPLKRLKAGQEIHFSEHFSAIVEERIDDELILRFTCAPEAFWQHIESIGTMPLPPYIERKRSADRGDSTTYQTVYAKDHGSVAAPTAGLHFTPALLQSLQAKGVEIAYVTLHVGGGTFLPVKADNVQDHVMHSEWAVLSAETAAHINAAKQRGGRVVAVGSTSTRTLEAAAHSDGVVQAYQAETDIFITPGYRFKVVDIMLTNFHLPKSTLLMLISAFSGMMPVRRAYAHAIEQGYRFFSYGDATLLFPQKCEDISEQE